MHVRWVIALVFVSLSFSRPVRAQFTLVNVGHATNYPNGFAYGISVVGNYAYLANGSGDGLRIFVVSDPAKPVSIGQTNVTGDLTRVIVSNNRAYVDASGLKIYDVSDPANPSFLGGGTNSDVFLHAVSGNHAFLVSDYGGLRIYDVSNPTAPFSIGYTNIGPYSYDVAIAGNYAYLAGSFSNVSMPMVIYDISNPAQPALVGRLTNNNTFIHSVAIAGNYLYAGVQSNVTVGLRIYDISNPTNPSPVGFVSTGLGPQQRMVVSSNYVFVAGAGMVRVYDVSNPANPFQVGQTPPFFGINVKDVATSGNYVYGANGVGGIRVYLLVPQLSIRLDQPNVCSISWSAPPVNSFVLQQNADLATTNWVDVTNAPVVVSNRDQVVIAPSPGLAFYRLRSP